MCHIVSLITNFLYIDIHIIIWHLISKDFDTLLHLIEHTALYYLYVVVINVISTIKSVPQINPAWLRIQRIGTI